MFGVLFVVAGASEGIPVFQPLDPSLNITKFLNSGPKSVSGDCTRMIFLKETVPFVQADHCIFRSISAEYTGAMGYGGAVYVEHGEISSFNSSFTECRASSGGGMAIFDSSSNIFGASFVKCSAIVQGGAVIAAGCTVFSVIHEAHGHTGDFIWENAFNFLTMCDCVIQYCTSGVAGAMTLISIADCFIKNTMIQSCVGRSACGALLAFDTNIVSQNNLFLGNRIYAEASALKDAISFNEADEQKKCLKYHLSLDEMDNICTKKEVKYIEDCGSYSPELLDQICSERRNDRTWYQGKLRGANRKHDLTNLTAADNILVMPNKDGRHVYFDSANTVYDGLIAYEKLADEKCNIYYHDIVVNESHVRFRSSSDRFTSSVSFPSSLGVSGAKAKVDLPLEVCDVESETFTTNNKIFTPIDEESVPANTNPARASTPPTPSYIKQLHYGTTLSSRPFTLSSAFTPSDQFTKSLTFQHANIKLEANGNNNIGIGGAIAIAISAAIVLVCAVSITVFMVIKKRNEEVVSTESLDEEEIEVVHWTDNNNIEMIRNQVAGELWDDDANFDNDFDINRQCYNAGGFLNDGNVNHHP